MMRMRDRLWAVRCERARERIAHQLMLTELDRSTRGMSSQSATRLGGTGHCPLCDHVDRYAALREEAAEHRAHGDALWAELTPELSPLDKVQRYVIEGYYNGCRDWLVLAQEIRRSMDGVLQVHKAALRVLEGRTTIAARTEPAEHPEAPASS